jgi:hypothetical protein
MLYQIFELLLSLLTNPGFHAVLANSVEVKNAMRVPVKTGNYKMIDGMADRGLKNLLRLAVEKSDYERVEMMLARGVEGKDVLPLAVEKGDYKMVEIMLDYGVEGEGL